MKGLPGIGIASSSRCFSTGRTAYRLRNTEQHRKLLQERKDSRLRTALNLFHISKDFYPTKATVTFQRPLELGDDDEKKPLQQSSTLNLGGRRRKNEVDAQPRQVTLHSFDKELDARIAASLRIRKTDEEIREAGEMELLVQRSNTRSPIFFSSADAALDRSLSAPSATENVFAEATISDDSTWSMAFASDLYAPMTTPQEELPPVEDAAAIKKYLANQVRRAISDDRKRDSTEEPLQNLDNRRARLRDALYGTIQAVSPNLETVRERAKEMELAKKNRGDALKSGGSEAIVKEEKHAV